MSELPYTMRSTSNHDEVVFSCFRREDTPDSVLAALDRHLGLRDEEPADLDPESHPYPLLVPSDNSRLPGGHVVSLRRTVQEVTSSGEQYARERRGDRHS